MSTLSTTVSSNAGQGVREITLGQAIREALAEELRRDPRVFIMGEDVAEAGTAFKVLTGLVEEFADTTQSCFNRLFHLFLPFHKSTNENSESARSIRRHLWWLCPVDGML